MVAIADSRRAGHRRASVLLAEETMICNELPRPQNLEKRVRGFGQEANASPRGHSRTFHYGHSSSGRGRADMGTFKTLE